MLELVGIIVGIVVAVFVLLFGGRNVLDLVRGVLERRKSSARLDLDVAYTSALRTTLITPTSGRKLRIIGYTATSSIDDPVEVEIYFGTGASFQTDSQKHIDKIVLRKEHPSHTVSFAYEEQPIGNVDEVASFRTNPDVGDKVSVSLRPMEE